MTWIEVTNRKTGKTLWVNLDLIRSLSDPEEGEGTILSHSNGDYITVKETREDIRARLSFPVRKVNRTVPAFEEPKHASPQPQGAAPEASGSPAG